MIERWAIEETLKLTNDNREEAAKVLGIGARTLYRRLDQYKKDEELAPERLALPVERCTSCGMYRPGRSSA